MRAKLRQLKETDPEFWKELTSKYAEELAPPENVPQPEDGAEDLGTLDDSDVPLKLLTRELTAQGTITQTTGYIISEGGAIVSNSLAEQFEEEENVRTNTDGGDKEHGRGKRLKQANRLYNAKTFWMHGDDNSDEECF
jgi:hypothetical protein